MGADLYIESLSEQAFKKWNPKFKAACLKRNAAKTRKQKEKAQKAVDYYYEKMYSRGYFRDSYNATNVLWRYGLSYWSGIDEKFFNEDKNLTVEGARWLLHELETRKIKLPTEKELKEDHVTVDNKENSLEVWNKFYLDKAERLKKFLKTAIKLNKPIVWSV